MNILQQTKASVFYFLQLLIIKLIKKHAFKSGEQYKSSQDYRLLSLKKDIEQLNQKSQEKLNALLLDEFNHLKIKYEEKQLTGKAKKRLLNIDDITALKPFHWGYHFDKILKHGVDAIITNPPWEIFKPQAKEFFAQYSDLVTKNKMDIKTFEKQQKKLLANPEIAEAWLEYQSQYPYVSAYYRSSQDYKNQISIVNGKKVGTDINLYKLFLERCFHLLRDGGECGIVIPSGIYTDLGSKQLREMLFTQTKVTGLFCLENRKAIFEGVDSRFKIVVLTFEKNGSTTNFPSAFMRHDVQELQRFPNADSLDISVDMVRKLSPNSLSVMEFKDEVEHSIAQKIVMHPQLSETKSGFEHIKFTRELAPDNKSKLFHTYSGIELLPLLEGKIIHQFTHKFSNKFRYWIREADARKVILGKKKNKEEGQKLDYQTYRLAFRKIARNTDERTMIATVIPPSLCVENLQTVQMLDKQGNQLVSYEKILYLCAVWNSFTYDSIIRLKVSANINFFFVYSTQVPHLTENNKYFPEIVQRAAKLICTTPEFDELAQDVGLDSHKNGIIDETQRAQLRAELDGIIAHLYGLTEEEFAYILTTFPLVLEETKQAALKAYQDFAPMSGDIEIISLIEQGENDQIEFKSTARWNLRENKKDKAMEHEIVKTVAAFLNTNGGTLLIGVDDDGIPLGLNSDYQTLGKKNSDGYMLFLNNDLLLREIGKQFGTLFRITFHQLSGQDVCRVVVQPSPKPIYVRHKDKNGKEEEVFYIRSNNSTVKLSTKEAVEYIRSHWD